MKSLKKALFGLIVLMLLFAPVGTKTNHVQAASAKTYQRRAKKVKKNLPKKIKKMLKKRYYKPSCQVWSSSRKGSKLTCKLGGGIGDDGGYYVVVRVNLKNGKVRVLENMVGLPTTFKVSMK